ncbi:MAG: endonuclease III [Firmicutes bacterium]|nr:endonuclease III [Bacillota bacterium]
MKKLTKKQKNEIVARLEQTYGGTGPALRFASVWQLLVAVVLSAQTNDNQVNRITEPLFRTYPDAASLCALTPEQLEPLISTCGLYKNKARNLIAAAHIVQERYGGRVPDNKEELTALPGVGNKSANVILSVGYGIPALAVDTHVHRVSNRMGLAESKTPDQTEAQLTALIPREKWSAAHHWLIWHGRRCCDARKPRCLQCPVGDICPSAPLLAPGAEQGK